MAERSGQSRLSAADESRLRDVLSTEREEAAGRLAALAAEFEGLVEASRAVAADDEHDPESAAIAFERAQVATLANQTRSRVADLDDALARLDAGCFGDCERCGEPIAAERLAARPAARTCIRCAASEAR